MVEIYDLECFPNFFSYTGLDRDSDQVYQFYIHRSVTKGQYSMLMDFMKHLDKVKGLIGYNNINYDYPLLHFLIERSEWMQHSTAEDITRLLYQESQRIIKEEWTAIPDKEVKIYQLDLFKVHHFDNKAKRTSLKDLEIAMDYPVVQDLPLPFNKPVKDSDVKDIMQYNLNDVRATKMFLELSKAKVELRKTLQQKYKLPLLNASNTKIGSELLLDLYCKRSGLNKYDVKKLRTYRKYINFKDIIFPYIYFNSKEFKQGLEYFKSQIIKGDTTKDAIKHSIVYKDFKYDYGTGGIHGCITPGIYEAEDGWVIIDADVTSLYPSIAIVNKLYPHHLGRIFCTVYDEDIVSVRKAEKAKKKDGDKAIVDGFKEAANATYGNSNSQYSWLYDPQYTMATTMNGQLMLTMLAEWFVDNIPGAVMLQINTDGLTLKIRKEYEGIYYELCKKWEKLTMLELEYKYYSKMVIRDVNNYLAVDTFGEVKLKGAFEIKKEWHKDPSFRIVPIALQDYFVKNVPVEETIRNHSNIYDFCGRYKSTKGWHSELRYVDFDKTGNPYIKRDKLQKTNRYFLSKSGGAYMKCHEDGREQWIIKSRRVKIFNNYYEKPMKEYDIDYSFYEIEARKIIRIVDSKQIKETFK